MSKSHKLQMEVNGYKLTDTEKEGIYTPEQFSHVFFMDYEDGKHAEDIDGTHFWMTGFRVNDKNEVELNQKPLEVVFAYKSSATSEFFRLNKDGEISKRHISAVDKYGNSLYICSSEKQAKYMYNKDLVDSIGLLEYRQSEIEELKDEIVESEEL